MNGRLIALRSLFGAILLVTLSACTGGINAGEKGGRAFIAFAGMLLATLGIMWIIIGREK
jgi:CHAT domain-containing protein